MPTFEKISAWIEVDGEALPEFGAIRTRSGSAVMCWVPSEADKQFSVCWKDAHLEYTLIGIASLDGLEYGMVLQYPDDKDDASIKLDSIPTGAIYAQGACLFQRSIDWYDDDRSLPFNNKGLGEIHLVLRKAEVTRKTSPADISTDLHRDTKRHESSKQTGHCIMLGTEISDESTPCFHVNEFKGAVATFIFRYRPLDFLRLNGIAPKQQRTSTPPEDERKRALAVKIEAKEAELRCLKEQQARFRSPSHIKAEITAMPSSSQSASGSSCVIDLTDLD